MAISKYKRAAIYERDGYVCVYCKESLDRDTATLDHLMPKVHGGSDDVTNLVTSCQPCNARKGDRIGIATPAGWQWKRHPYF